MAGGWCRPRVVADGTIPPTCSLPGIAELHSAFFRFAGAGYNSAIPGEHERAPSLCSRTRSVRNLTEKIVCSALALVNRRCPVP